ncbi:hypothetical protein WJX75_006240 [Coccomyxa subellipsoidea]|uniref:BZIP domain-containing protein n=1 Tax=Coccomyxa subellipsoidea TaxID=248742 RepID=A0ABR2YJT0_9CHLO
MLPLGIQDTCAACELHVAMRPEVNKAETGFPAAGSFSAQQVARMPSMGQDSSCADIDNTYNQTLERTGLECSANTVEDKCEDQELTAEELRRQKRRKINRESARRMRMKPRKEVEEQKTLVQVLLGQLALLQDAHRRLLDDYNMLRQQMVYGT